MTGTRGDLAALPLEEFAARIASAEPTPGGGSASAVAGSLAAALLSMVARLSEGRPRYGSYAATCVRAGAVGDGARTRFLELAEADAAAYGSFAAALKLPRDTEEAAAARQHALRSAAREATEIPLEILRACRPVAAELEALAGRSNTNASSDLIVGSLLVDAAARGAAANVMINLPSVGDGDFEGRALNEVTEALALIEDLAAQVREVVGRGKLREPEEA